MQRRPAGRPGPGPAHQGEARLRARARRSSSCARARTASPSCACTTARRAPGLPGRAWPTRASSSTSTRRSTRRCAGSAGSTAFELEPIEPAVAEWRYRNKLEYSFGERPGELLLGFHRRGSWAEIVDVEDCHPRLGGQQRGPQRRPRVGPSPGARRPRQPLRRPACCATSSSARAGAPGQIQTRLVTAPGDDPAPARRPAHGDRGAVGGHRRPRPVCSAPSTSPRRSAACACASRTPRSCRPTRRWPSASTGSSRSGPASPAASASSTSTAGSARSGSRSPATPARSGASRGSRTRSPTPSTTRPRTGSRTRASSCADARLGDRAAAGARRAARTWSSSTRRARACPRRSCAGCSSARRRGSSTSPATPRRWRPTRLRSSRRAIRCAA